MIVALLAGGDSASLAAGFEEEGVPVRIERAAGVALELAREAAGASDLGLGIGGDESSLALVLAAASVRAYLEAPAAEARHFGQAAARVAARRPLKT